jgi:hypothetical protein
VGGAVYLFGGLVLMARLLHAAPAESAHAPTGRP